MTLSLLKSCFHLVLSFILTYLACNYIYIENIKDKKDSIIAQNNEIKEYISHVKSMEEKSLLTLKEIKSPNLNSHLLSLLAREKPQNVRAFFDYWENSVPYAELSEEIYESLTYSLTHFSDHELNQLFNGLNSPSAAYFLPRVFNRMAKTDPQRMYALSQKMSVGINSLESIVFDQWAQTDPQQAMKTLLANDYITTKQHNGAKVFKNWLSKDPSSALAWYTETAGQSIDLLSYMNVTMNFLESVPSRKLSEAELQSTINSLNQISDQRDKTRAYRYLIDSIAKIDPVGARKLIDSIDNHSQKWQLETNVTTAEVVNNPAAIDELIFEAGLSGPKKEEIAELAAQKLLQKEAKEALDWAQTISDPIARDAAHKQYAYEEVKKDLSGVMALIKKTSSDYDREALWSGVEKALPELTLTANQEDLDYIQNQLKEIKK
jgi:hypothetical protein